MITASSEKLALWPAAVATGGFVIASVFAIAAPSNFGGNSLSLPGMSMPQLSLPNLRPASDDGVDSEALQTQPRRQQSAQVSAPELPAQAAPVPQRITPSTPAAPAVVPQRGTTTARDVSGDPIDLLLSGGLDEAAPTAPLAPESTAPATAAPATAAPETAAQAEDDISGLLLALDETPAAPPEATGPGSNAPLDQLGIAPAQATPALAAPALPAPALPAPAAPAATPPAATTASSATFSEGPELETIAAVDQLAIQNETGAGGNSWNARFPWIGVAPFLVDGVNPIPNPDLPPPLVANRAEANSSTAVTGDAPRSFLLGRNLDAPLRASAPSAAPVQPAAQAQPEPASQPAPQVATAPQAATGEIEAQDSAALSTAYGRQVSTLIAENRNYPPEFEAERLEGSVLLGLVLDKRGDLSQIVVLESSGDARIDTAAQTFVTGLDFPTPPAAVTEQQLRYGVRMDYIPPT